MCFPCCSSGTGTKGELGFGMKDQGQHSGLKNVTLGCPTSENVADQWSHQPFSESWHRLCTMLAPDLCPSQWQSQGGPLMQGHSWETQLSHGQLHLKNSRAALPNLALRHFLPTFLPSLPRPGSDWHHRLQISWPSLASSSFSLTGGYPSGCLHV